MRPSCPVVDVRPGIGSPSAEKLHASSSALRLEYGEGVRETLALGRAPLVAREAAHIDGSHARDGLRGVDVDATRGPTSRSLELGCADDSISCFCFLLFCGKKKSDESRTLLPSCDINFGVLSLQNLYDVLVYIVHRTRGVRESLELSLLETTRMRGKSLSIISTQAHARYCFITRLPHPTSPPSKL